MPKIVFVTSAQPSANPRLVKEINALICQRDFDITVVYVPISPWADLYDESLFNKYPSVKWIRTGFHSTEQKWLYRYARVRRKLYGLLYMLLGDIQDASIKSLVLFNQELWRTTKKIQADVYIGHNLGALPVVVKAAKKHKAKAVFDFEDFHRGEDQQESSHWIKTSKVENKYTRFLAFASVASPLIEKEYRRYFLNTHFITINNCFSGTYAHGEHPELIKETPLKLFWFSQTIGTNRGLENVIRAMGLLKTKKVQLVLLGNVTEIQKSSFEQLALNRGLEIKQLVFLNPTEEEEIVKISSTCHIGLACEVRHILNRELCLTNKIFTYLLAGNAILFSKTSAQVNFLKTYPDIGLIYEQEQPASLASLIELYMLNPNLLLKHRQKSLHTAKAILNWEEEQKKWLPLIDHLLINN